MELSQKKWTYGGAGILAAISAIIVLRGVPNVWVPMPFPIVLVSFIASIFFLFVTPSLYVLVLKLFSPLTHFPKIVFSLIVAFGVLNILYFKFSWDYGLKYQGETHTKIVAIENLVGFGTAVLVGSFALGKNSRHLALFANLFLFMLLSWCAFPYLGELP